MKSLLDKIIPEKSMIAVLLVIVFTGGVLAALIKVPALLIGSNYSAPTFFALYGIAAFILYPVFIGILTIVLAGYHKPVSIGDGIAWSLLALIGVALSMLLYAIEGLICVVMASPLCIFCVIVGSLIGHALNQSFAKRHKNVFSCFAAFILLFPAAGYLENRDQTEPETFPVTTSVIINAPPEKIWKNVVEFPEIAPPAELVFKTGIAYPVRARIAGTGAGAARYCDFSTGTFIETVTVWDENKELEFSVDEQPVPMKEFSPYGDLDTPHLHGFFVSRKGQFKLTRLENGRTLLEGTSWYYHKIRPEFYWRLWSEEIIHTIHRRVLEHIKERSENE